jgi:8-oxo-dGTP pyrophosphatase MutT (NUDIX family)
MQFTIDQIRDALGRHQPQIAERGLGVSEASVALVLAGSGTDLSLCAIRRAEHPLDPWSGHMALPGGRVDPGDPHSRAAAERETLEEVGLALGDAHWIGSLSEMQVRLGGSDRRMVLSPFVYDLGEEHLPFAPNHEVAEAFWIPLAHLWDPNNMSRLKWERQGTSLLYPAIRYQGHSIWGITFRVLTLFSDVLDAPLPHLEEIPGLGR